MWEGKEPNVQKAPGNTFQFYLGDRSFNFLSSQRFPTFHSFCPGKPVNLDIQ